MTVSNGLLVALRMGAAATATLATVFLVVRRGCSRSVTHVLVDTQK